MHVTGNLRYLHILIPYFLLGLFSSLVCAFQFSDDGFPSLFFFLSMSATQYAFTQFNLCALYMFI